MTNSKQARQIDNFSPKDHFDLPYIDRYTINSVDGMNVEVLGGCVDEKIV